MISLLSPAAILDRGQRGVHHPQDPAHPLRQPEPALQHQGEDGDNPAE